MSTVLWIVGGLSLFVMAALFSVGRPKRSERRRKAAGSAAERTAPAGGGTLAFGASERQVAADVRAAAAHAPLLHSERQELEELRRMRAAALKSGKSE